MKCPHCGKEIANDSEFCEYCGTRVDVAEQPQVSYNGQERPMMSFVDAVKTCFSKYATFSGRATRAEYWWFCLFNFCVSMVAAFLDGAAGTYNYELNTGLIRLLATLALMLPGLAVSVRRCHDTNHSGWWILCPIYNFVLMFYESDPDANDYGELEA